MPGAERSTPISPRLRVDRSKFFDLACLAACVAAFSAWNLATAPAPSWEVPAVFLAFGLACLMMGDLAGRVMAGRVAGPANFARSFLIGFFLIGIALLVLAVATPFGLRVDSAILGVLVVGVRILVPVKAERPGAEEGDPRWCLGAVAVSLVAASLWSQTALRPVVEAEGQVIHQPWVDSYWHATQIRMFRDSRGFGSLQDFRVAGERPLFYHYAGYMAPALLSAWTPTTTFLAYNGFMVPLGIFLTGLAAFALAGSWWGDRAGFGATVALLLLPDASVLGPGSRWLSYHWLQQIAPTGAIGTALLAVAWMLMIEGCRAGSLRKVGAGDFLAFLSIQFKAHLFVANAFWLWVYPPIFLKGLGPRRRIAWLALASAIFVGAVAGSQRFERVPLLRPSLVAAGPYMTMVIRHSGWKDWVQGRFPGSFGAGSPYFVDLGLGSILLFFGTFGLIGVAALALAISNLPRVEPPIRVFPLIIMGNYLMMSLMLLLDNREVATPEELQHRPLVWAYFGVAAWVGGIVGSGLLPVQARHPRAWGSGLVAASVLLMVVPWSLGREVPEGPGFGRALVRQPVPRGLLDCCRYLRDRAGVGEVVQDSGDDPLYQVTALSERQAFAIAGHITFAPRESLRGHLAEHKALRLLESERTIRDRATRDRIDWYLLRPADRVAWPGSVRYNPAFQSGGYRVYRLTPPPRS